MERTSVLCVVLLVATAAVPAAVAGQSDQVTLTVTVVDQQGRTVPDASITASWDGGNTTETTRANGQALIDVPDGVDVALDVESDRHVRNTPYTVESAETESVEVSVARKGSATITAVNRQGNRVADPIVRLWQDGNLVVNRRANGQGVVETGVLEQDEYALVVFKEGYFKNRSTLTVDGQVNRTVSIESGSVTVRFAVSDDHFGPPEPVRDARIEVGDIGSVRTLDNGDATIQVPVNDRYDVTVTKANYTAATPSVSVGEAETTVNVTINREPRISITPAADRVVSGEPVAVTVTDEYGTPVANATVSLDGDEVGVTDADGELSVRVESPGTHTIAASKGDLRTTYDIQAFEPTSPTDEPTDTATDTAEDTATGTGPGFGAVAALVALLAVGVLARRRR